MAAEPKHAGGEPATLPEQVLPDGANPYAPPAFQQTEPNLESPPTDARAFTTTAVGFATFFGSALAGTIVMYWKEASVV